MASSRASPKLDHVVRILRNQIADGVYAPGQQLPVRKELSAAFDVTPVTLQKAFDRLIEEGFVATRGRGGTFVAPDPPCDCRFALIFSRQGKAYESLQFRAVRDAMPGVEAALGVRIEVFREVYDPLDGAIYGADGERLLADMEARRVAGLIFVQTPIAMAGTRLTAAGPIPRVGWMRRARPELPGMGAVWTDDETFVDRALQALAERGATRVGLVTLPANRDQWVNVFRERAAAAGLTAEARWIQGVSFTHTQWAANCVELLMQGGPPHRPDGLIIADDHLAPHSAAGLLAAHIRVPEDVQVVAHCNYPVRERPLLPFLRLGYDAAEVLRAGVDWVRRTRADGAPGPDVRVLPRFSWEQAGDEAPPA